MKSFFRIFIAAVLSPIWVPGVLAFFAVTSPYWIIGGVLSLAGFVITGEWAWPEIG